MAHLEHAPPPPVRRRCHFATVSLAVSAVLLAALLAAHAASAASRCGSHAWLAWAAERLAFAGVALPPAAATQDMCRRVHEFTSACLLLSGEVVPPAAGPTSLAEHVWRGATQLWSALAGAPAAAPTRLYERDVRDVLFAVTWGVVLYVLRGALMAAVLVPLARVLVQRPADASAKSAQRWHKSVTRFAEQSWILLLYTTSFVLVCGVVRRQPFWPLKTEHFWIGYPHTTMDAATKSLYLWEASNYLHQLIVVCVEERRSDFAQMMFHHVLTLTLIFGSYVTCFHRIGLMILFLLDPSDILLAAAKLIRYMGYQTLCDAAFTLFMLTWIVERHGIFSIVYYSSLVEAPRLLQFIERADLAAGNFMTITSYWVFNGLLGLLQVILLIWCSMILGVAYRVLTNAGAVDSRSDDSE